MRHQPRDAIRELDFATHTAWLVADLFEDAGGKDVAPSHPHAGGGHVGFGLFHDALNAHQLSASGFPRDDAVLVHLVLGHLLHGNHRPALLAEGRHHLRQHRLAALGAHHQVVGQ